MKTQDLTRYAQLNAEMYEMHQIANDIENNHSDDVMRARKEIERIKHDIANLLDAA
jgi:hypothetical protein